MNGIVLLVILFVFFGLGLALFAFLAYRRVLRRAKSIERGLKMVPLLIHLPPPSDDVEIGSRDQRDVLREKISQAQVLYDLIAGTAQGGFKSSFYGQRHIALEIIASNGLVHYFAAVPIALVSVVEQAIVTAYPGARLEEVEDHNIFNPQGRLSGTMGGELTLRHQAAYPIATYETMERDPMEALFNALSKIKPGEGAAVQVMLRPARSTWTKASKQLVDRKRRKHKGMEITPMSVAKAAVKAPKDPGKAPEMPLSKLEEDVLQAVEQKTTHPGYEVLIRVLTSSPNVARSEMILRDVANAFSIYEAPGLNGFQFVPARDVSGLVTAFIFRFFPPELTSNILNSQELATLYHIPDAQFTPTATLKRQTTKQVDGPIGIPAEGLLFGYNIFRGVQKEIRLSVKDRRRHTYIVGQTGTGKSTILENLAVQDMMLGNGFAFIDPHGDTAEKLLSMVPKHRAEDVIYFNPGDTEHPLGFNLFEHDTPQQRDFIVQETINMLVKIYGQEVIGPRFEQWFRNAALTLMADPNGSTLIEIPKVFTDDEYLKQKFKHLTDQTVIDFWTKEMGQTSDYHKSEMLGYFVSKFGAFQQNETMRNILGQTKSAFDLRDIMDNKKILIVNLSKGALGELNSRLMGMIFVTKFQAAAMSRNNMPEDERKDFCLYVDEFQNFSTDSFASILSEARKYRLNIIVANQYVSQLSDQIRDAVFGNVGNILCFRTGPEDAEFLAKQFAPIFEARDLLNIPNFNAIMRLMINNMPSEPFSITMLPDLGVQHPEMGIAVQQLSAAKFGVSKAQVEADITRRLSPAKAAAAPAPQPVTIPKPAQPAPVAEPVQAAPTPAPAEQKPAPQALAPEPIAPKAEPETLALPAITNHTAQTGVEAPQPIAQAPKPVEEPIPTPTPAPVPNPEPKLEAKNDPAPAPRPEEPKHVLSLTKLKDAGAKKKASAPAKPAEPEAHDDVLEHPQELINHLVNNDKPVVSDEPHKEVAEPLSGAHSVKPDPTPEVKLDDAPKPKPAPTHKKHEKPPVVAPSAVPAEPILPVPDDEAAAEQLLAKLQQQHKEHTAGSSSAAKAETPDSPSQTDAAPAPAGDTLAVSATGQIVAPGEAKQAAPDASEPAETPAVPKAGTTVMPKKVESSAATPASKKPDLKPGEMHVDENGNVIVG